MSHQPLNGTLHTYADAEELAQQAAAAFVDLALSIIDANGVFRVSLSGGSTPKRLYELLAEASLPWESIEWYWGDERQVPHDHVDSNYRMVKQALLDRVPIAAAQVHPVPYLDGQPQQAALQYQQVLETVFPDSPWPEFDLILLGLGDDAHTASLFPETAALQQDERWFVENWVPKFDAFRLTMTAPAINAAANVWFLVAGTNKRQSLANVWSPTDRNSQQYPSQLVDVNDGVLWWMVTADALPSD